MRFYNNLHQYYCGIDLHTRTMYVCVLDQDGNKLQHKNLECSAENLHKVLKPYLPNVAIAVECMFTWYWIADFCQKENIPFVLGHALYMKAVHGGKTKSDKIDSYKIAGLLRSGISKIPKANTIYLILKNLSPGKIIEAKLLNTLRIPSCAQALN